MEKFLLWLQSLDIPNPPHNIESLMQMQELDLSYKGLSYLPDEICKLTNLKSLNLIRNELRFLPDDFGKLKNLTKLGLCSNNDLVNISEVSDLTNLRWLNLSGSRNIQIPNLSKLQNLKCLYLQNINITENVIPDILQAKNIEMLNISQNHIHNFDEFSKLRNLKYIVFDADDWNAKLPKWLDNENWICDTDVIRYFDAVYVCKRIK